MGFQAFSIHFEMIGFIVEIFSAPNLRLPLRPIWIRLIIQLLSLSLLVVIAQPARADVPTVPTLVSFTMSPNNIDIATPNTTITFDLIVSNQTGIASTQAFVTFTDGTNNSIVIPIVRLDSPINNSLQTVEFRGTYTVPSNLPTGVYTATSTPITGLTATGATGYSTQSLSARTNSTLLGAVNALTIRNGGYLNLAYSTFVGPTFNTLLGNKFVNQKYNSQPAPVWKVGESFNPSDYYELQVPSLALKVKTATPTVCTTDGVTLTLISGGICGFTVYTDKTVDYQYKQDVEVVTVTAARTKPIYSVGSIPTQSSSVLPLSISGPFIYTPSGIIIPISATPSVCYPVGTYITVISGGTCTLNYSSPATANLLASDVYPLTFQITRTPQTVNFSVPATITVSSRPLSLSASSSTGLPVTFRSLTPTVCSVTQNSLSLLAAGACGIEADQVGTTTISPASSTQTVLVTAKAPVISKKVNCSKNKKIKVVIGVKCPDGQKVVKKA